MKKLVIAFVLTFSFLLCQTLQAQQTYHPTDKWPYLFENFLSATVHQTNGGNIVVDANICIDDGTVHYVDAGVIKAYAGNSVGEVDFGERHFIFVNGSFKEIVAEDGGAYVLKETVVDHTASDGVDIGFGIVSSTTAAQSVDMTASSGLGTALLHAKVAEASAGAQYGNPLKTMDKLYLYTGAKLINATKKDFTDAVGKQAAAEFLKANKIKWNDPSSLVAVLSCLKLNQ